ncbi:MAG: phosphodiester glycosidase family protein [Archangiaceae bacterium]|nr:phosphodiester glycosidase family protein [Archangiaceae bacterium]
MTQLAPGIVQGTIDGGTLVAADFTVPGVRFQLAGPEHAGQLPQTVLGEVPGAVAVMNGQMFHFGADHPEVLDGTQNMLGVLGNARANGVDWPAGQAVPEGAYLEFGKWGARLVTDGRPMAADAVDVIGVHDIVWQDGVSLEPQLGDSSFIQGHFGRTIYAVSEDGSHFYSWVNDAHHGLSVPQAAQKLVDMVNAMGLPPVKYAFNQDGGGSSSIATTGGVNDTLGRPLVSTATLVFDANANATGTFVDWTPPPRPHGKPAI